MRPSEYDATFCEQVIDLGKQGKSKAYIAAKLGVARQTLENWAKQHTEFLDALTRAMALSQAWWEDAGQKGMTADKFNSSVWSRSMAARFPEDWRENNRHEHTGRDGGPIEYANMTEAEIDARLADLARGAEPAPDPGEA